MDRDLPFVPGRATTTSSGMRLHGVRILLLLGLAAFLSACCWLPYRPPPPEVAQAAVEGLRFFSERLPPEALAQFGYSDGQALARSDLRPPYQLHLIPTQSLKDYRPGDPAAQLLVATDRWLFPVAHHGEVRALLKVDRLDGRLRAVSMGNRNLATSLESIRGRWSASEGYRLKYARAGIADMVIITYAGVERIVPLAATGLALQLQSHPDGLYGLHTPAELLPKLLPSVTAPVGGAR